MNVAQLAELRLSDFTEADLRSQADCRASKLTTFGVGGPFELLLEPQTLEAAAVLLSRINDAELGLRILGAGSNVLVSDQGVRGPTLKLGKGLNAWSIQYAPASLADFQSLAAGLTSRVLEPESDEAYVLVLGASSLMSLSRHCCGLGLSGLEFAAGIPASLGGAIRMNAGAHGSEMAAVVSDVLVLTRDGKMQLRTAAQMQFRYRGSTLEDGALILGATLRLRQDEPSLVLERRTQALAYRRASQPLHLPSAGSVFKNPEGTRAAAQMLEELGFKGRERGGIAFSSQHANWLVRMKDPASASDAAILIAEAQEAVEDRFGVVLEAEIRSW